MNARQVLAIAARKVCAAELAALKLSPAEREAAHVKVQAAIQDLPEPERRLFTFRYICDLTADEIVGVSGMHYEDVIKHLGHALNLMQRALAEFRPVK